jgi:hypothetical protein
MPVLASFLPVVQLLLGCALVGRCAFAGALSADPTRTRCMLCRIERNEQFGTRFPWSLRVLAGMEAFSRVGQAELDFWTKEYLPMCTQVCTSQIASLR